MDKRPITSELTDLKSCKLLSIDDFAEEMSVSSNTVREWISNGILVEKKHFIKLRSVTRIPWPYVLKILLTDDKKLEEVEDKKLDKKKTKNLSSRLKSINLDY